MPAREARAAALALPFLLFPVLAAAADCAPGSLDLREEGATLRFQVEVADDEVERARGLMFRESMPEFSGMLFIYEEPQPVAFWMRNTLIPLDMLFFDGTGTLRRVHSNAVPLDETPIPGGNDIRYVLEINGGLAAELGIDVGAELRHPGIDQAAAVWPCDG
jgi:uncharacterized membrane protein (UPF0127 family)